MDVQHLEKVRANMETKANDKRRDDDMHAIGQLLLQLNEVESQVAQVRKLSDQDRLKVRVRGPLRYYWHAWPPGRFGHRMKQKNSAHGKVKRTDWNGRKREKRGHLCSSTETSAI